MRLPNLLEKKKGSIIEAWLVEVTAACQIEDEAGCRKFLADYFSIILNNLSQFDPKLITYLKKSLSRGFLSGFSLDQIFKFHLSLKHVLENVARENPSGPQVTISHNPWLLITFQQLDKYFLRILGLFGSQFNLAINYYRDRYTNLSENISEIVYSLSPRGNFNYISPSIKKSLAIAPEKLQTIDDLMKHMPQEDREEYLRKFASQIENKTELKMELRLISKGRGRTGYFINHSLPNLDSWGNLISVEGILFDITELKESEEKYRKLIETASDAIFIVDAKTGIILDVNKKAEELLGRPAEKIIGMHQTQFHPKEEAELYRKIFQSQVQTGKAILEDLWVCHQDGRKIPVEINASVTELGGKKIVQGIFRNITERKRVEEALRQSARELNIRNRIGDIFLTVPDEKVYGKALHVVLEAMESKYGVFGYIDEDEALICPSMTRDIWDKCKVPDKNIVFPRKIWGGIWGRALIEKRPFCSNESSDVPEGHIPIFRSLAVPIIHQGEVIGLLLVANKATDYDENDQELLKTIAGSIAPIIKARLQRDIQERGRKQAEEFYRTLIETASRAGEGILLVSYEGDAPQNIFANEEVCRITGYPEDELLGFDLKDFVAPESIPLIMEIYKRRKAGQEDTSAHEVTLLHKDGHRVFIEARSAQTTFKDISCSVVFFRDITEKKLKQDINKKTK